MSSEFESWEAEDASEAASYSQNNFYVRASDKSGHWKSFRWGPGNQVISLPPHIYGRLMEMKNTFPMYRTNADVIRDAVVHLLHMRAEQQPNMPIGLMNAIRLFEAEAGMDAFLAKAVQHEKILHSAQEAVNTAGNSRVMLTDAIMQMRLASFSVSYPEYAQRLDMLISTAEQRLRYAE